MQAIVTNQESSFFNRIGKIREFTDNGYHMDFEPNTKDLYFTFDEVEELDERNIPETMGKQTEHIN